jgi:hypothetical protein
MDKNSAAATPAPMAKAKSTIQSSPSLRMARRIAKRHCGRHGTHSRDSTIRSAMTALASSPRRDELPTQTSRSSGLSAQKFRYLQFSCTVRCRACRQHIAV